MQTDNRRRLGLARLLSVVLVSVIAAPVAVFGARPVSDSASVRSVVEQFHRALSSGDSSTALSLLSSDVLVIESGGIESRADYRAHHLPADIEFARAVKSERTTMRVSVQGDAAWVVSQSTTRGRFRDRDVNSAGAELMVLRRTRAGCRISAVHWSSRRRTTN
jgi:ketosteroid isomerase-like protein